MQALQKKKALRMIRGSGQAAVTQYSCGVVDEAKKTGVLITVIKRDPKTGKKRTVNRKPRKVHRDLFDVFGDTHVSAGRGKYIDLKAFLDGDKTHVVGAQFVNPYLREDGAYPTIIEVFKQDIGKAVLAKQRSSVARSRQEGTHLLWHGRRVSDDFVVTSDWFTEEQIWKMGQRQNSELLKALKKSRSGRQGATHRSAREKFLHDLDVLRRATCVLDVATGEVEFRGGATPYSKPLEQCGFAIDKRFLTTGVDANGDEVGEYFYRLVIGRSDPHILPRTSWQYEGTTSMVAFRDDKARQAVCEARRAS